MIYSSRNHECRPFNEYSKNHSNCSCNHNFYQDPTNGSVNNYENYIDVDGEQYNISNKNYYDNYYTTYNDYYVTDYNYVTDHYFDYNIYHYDSKTIYNGSEYMGCENIVHNGNGGYHPMNQENHPNNCHCGQNKPNHHGCNQMPPMNNHNHQCGQKCGWGKCCKRNCNC